MDQRVVMCTVVMVVMGGICGDPARASAICWVRCGPPCLRPAGIGSGVRSMWAAGTTVPTPAMLRWAAVASLTLPGRQPAPPRLLLLHAFLLQCDCCTFEHTLLGRLLPPSTTPSLCCRNTSSSSCCVVRKSRQEWLQRAAGTRCQVGGATPQSLLLGQQQCRHGNCLLRLPDKQQFMPPRCRWQS